MKKLHLYMLKSFIGPFFATFFISMFVLLMQMLWRYIDELVGKGLDFSIIMELLFYFSMTLIPMALPLAVLLSSIMTFGNLGENYELIALKSAGISLYRIMFPLIIVVVLLSVATFLFSDNVLPVANMKSINLLHDIKKHKPELSFKEGVFTNDLEGYSIKVDRINKETGMMYDMLIYNHREVPTGNYELTKADSGLIISNDQHNYMELVLYHGNTYTDEGVKPTMRKSFPFRRLKFDKQTALIEMSGNDFKRSNDDYMTAMMMNLEQLDYTIDSVQNQIHTRQKEKGEHLLRVNYRKNRQRSVKRDSILTVESQGIINDVDSLFQSMDVESRQRAVDFALQVAREVTTGLQNDVVFVSKQEELIRKNQIEWHKKFTFPFACIIFFFIGAPLGGIIRKGGLGAPIVLSVFLFIIYYIISMIGERSAKEAALNVIFGSWLSSIVLLPLGILLTYQSVTDSEILKVDAYTVFVNKVIAFFKRKKMQKTKLRIVYMGTPDFAVYPLQKLLESKHTIVGVVTNPDKPAGRGQKLQESAVKRYAMEKGLKILQPEKFKDEEFLKELKALNADLNIVVAFKMLPEAVWGMPRLGTINLHASLLPHYRGAAPINRAIMDGQKMTGITTFLLERGMDTGRILFRKEVGIGEDMTAGELHDELMEKGGELLVETVDAMQQGEYPLLSQDELLKGEEAKHAPKIFKEDMRINWSADTDTVYNHIRGLSPFPTAWTELQHVETGETIVLKLFSVRKEITEPREPGKIETDGKTYFHISTSDGLILLDEIQLSGKKRMPVGDFLRGFSLGEYILS